MSRGSSRVHGVVGVVGVVAIFATAVPGATTGCSIFSDLAGLSSGDDSLSPGTSADGGSVAQVEGGGTSEGGGGGASCDRVRLTALGCEDVEYMPSGQGSTTAKRAASPEVLVFGQHDSSGVETLVTDDRTEPHVLVLASHDAATWRVAAKKPSAIVSIVLSGDEPSTVKAPAGVPTMPNTEDTPYAYEYPSADANALFQRAKDLTGATAVTAFAGCHSGVEVRIDDACP